MERKKLDDNKYLIGNMICIGYDEEKKILEIEYVHGFLYQYHNVPKEIYDKLMAEESKITFVQERIAKMFRAQRIK